jgi:hypothetical protein
MTREQVLERIAHGYAHWVDVDLTALSFLHDDDLRFEGDAVWARADRVVDEPAWDDLLDPRRRRLNATLLRDGDGRPFVALRAGDWDPRVSPTAELAVAVSLEPRPLYVRVCVARLGVPEAQAWQRAGIDCFGPPEEWRIETGRGAGREFVEVWVLERHVRAA